MKINVVLKQFNIYQKFLQFEQVFLNLQAYEDLRKNRKKQQNANKIAFVNKRRNCELEK